MPITRRDFHTGLLALFATVMMPMVGAEETLVEGTNWRPLSPALPSGDSEQIQVLKFFSYGCPHCGALNPLFKTWAKDLPEDVSYQRVPVTFGRAAWANLARLYYALEIDGHLEQLDQAVFTAITQERVNLFTEKNILKWIDQQGLDAEAFSKTFNSFAVEVALGRAQILESEMKIDAVPRIIVDGRFVVLNEGGGGYEGLLRTAKALVERARAQRQ